MNWQEFRKMYRQKHGPTPIGIIAREYKKTKRSPRSARSSPRDARVSPRLLEAPPKRSPRLSPRSSNIIIFTKPGCPWCVKAKDLLSQKGLTYKEFDVTNPVYLKEMLSRSNGLTTVPQIFIDNKHIGGYDRLSQLL